MGNSQLQRQQLYEDVVRHLDSQQVLLSRFIELAHQIQNTLGSQLNPDLSEFDQQQQQLKAQSDSARDKWTQIQARIAALLELPIDQASIRRLSESLPEPWSSELAARRERLIAMHEQINQMNRSNALLLQQSIDVYQSILLKLSGVPSTAFTYSSTGALSPAECGNLMRKGC